MRAFAARVGRAARRARIARSADGSSGASACVPPHPGVVAGSKRRRTAFFERSPLVELRQLDEHADTLIVTSNWPHDPSDEPAHPAALRYGIFLERQVNSLRSFGCRFDVLFIRGFASPIAYVLAAAQLFAWGHSRARSYTLVHAHGGEAAVAALCYRSANLVISYCGSDILGAPRADGSLPLRGRLRRLLLRQTARAASRTITKSSDMERCLPRRARARNTVIPNGVDAALFAPRARADARRELGWGGEPVALFAADPRIPLKRHGLAAEACARARAAIPDLRLEVASDVEPARMPTLMNAADCLLLTSLTEGSPNVVKEALMCNLPVVATDVGDVRELLEHVSPSYVCPADPNALAAAVVDCVAAGRRSDGRAISGHLTADAIARRVVAVYEEALGSDRAGASERRPVTDK